MRCGQPFNNTIKEKGRTRRLPTLWILDSCPKTNKSIMNWCYGEYVTTNTKAVNDPKPTPQQKNSHDNMVLEAFAKDDRVKHSSYFINNRPPIQGNRRVRSITGG